MPAQRFHITRDGTKAVPCHARVGACPLGADAIHATTEQEAYERQAQTLRLSSVPVKPPYTGPTKIIQDSTGLIIPPPAEPLKPARISEVIELIDRERGVIPDGVTRRQKMANRSGVDPMSRDARGGKILAAVLRGSGVYDLNIEGSDRDVLGISNAKGKHPFSKVYEDGADIVVMSTDDFVDRVQQSKSNEVDMLYSGKMDVGAGVADYLAAIRFSPYLYHTHAHGYVYDNTKTMTSDSPDDNHKRRLKAAKTCLRVATLGLRVLDQGPRDFTPVFTQQQRDALYSELHYFTPQVLKAQKGDEEKLVAAIDLAASRINQI